MEQTKNMVKTAHMALEEKKAEDIRVIDISGVSVMADYFIIASAGNQNQIQALMDNVEEKLRKIGCEPRQIEGNRASSWVLMDFRDIIVHIFTREDRMFYDLERIWRDGKDISITELE